MKRINKKLTNMGTLEATGRVLIFIFRVLPIFSRASRTLRDATQVVTFLSVTKKTSGRTEKVTLFNAFLQASLTDLDKIWHDGRSYGVESPKK